MMYKTNPDRKNGYRFPAAAGLTPVVALLAVALLTVLLFSAGCRRHQDLALTALPGDPHPYKTGLTVTAEEAAMLKQLAQKARDRNAAVKPAKIEQSGKADTYGFELESPRRGNFAVDTVFEVRGTVKLPDGVNYLMVSVTGNGRTSKQFIGTKGPAFSGRVYLPFGEGTYKVTILTADNAAAELFEGLAAFEVYNVNPEEISFPEYSRVMFTRGIRLTAEPAALVPGKFELAGEIKDYEENTAIMIRSQKAGEKEKFDQFARIRGGKFRADVYLPRGPGKYRVEVMTPKEGSENLYLGVASYDVENTEETVSEPVQYYNGYFRRGLLLDDFLRPGIRADNRILLEGSFVPERYEKYRAQNNGLYIETRKSGGENLVAHDWVSVEEGLFKGNIWLRFGPGEYEISIGLPSTNGSHDITFVAKFRATNTGTEDIRDLAPGRGIESDHPEIIRLARQLTEGRRNDRDKAQAIHDWVARNISYDVRKSVNLDFEADDSALKTLKFREGVCQDFTFLTVALARAAGLEARFVAGKTIEDGRINPNGHGWTEVKVDGSWLVMDTTWDAGHIDGDRFVRDFSRKYFDPDPAVFARDHIREEIIY